jgi:hypothetical protein
MSVTDTNSTTEEGLTDPEVVVSLSDQLAAEFERRQTQSGNDSGGSEGEGLAAGTETNDETTDLNVTGDEGEGEGGGAEVTDGATAPPSNDTQQQEGIPAQITQPEPPAQPSQFSMDEYAAQLYGRPLTQYEAEQLFAWQQQFAQLQPDQLNAIEKVIQGQPVTTPDSSTPSPDDDDNVDPYIQQHIQSALAPVQEQLAQVNQFVQTEAQRQAQAERDRVATQIESGTSAFGEKYGLSETDIQDLETRVVRSQVFPGLYNAFQGNADQAMQAALEQVYWSTPEYRERSIQAQIQQASSQEEADKTRKRKASALSGGGGAVSRDTPPPVTPQGRQAAMATELAEIMNGSGAQQT